MANKLRVLIADDNGDNTNLLAMIIRAWGHKVRVAYDGNAALATAVDSRPHVIIVDLMTPRFDGNKLARYVRASRDLAGVMLIAMTSQPNRDREFGHCLLKPTDPCALKELLDLALARRHIHDAFSMN